MVQDKGMDMAVKKRPEDEKGSAIARAAKARVSPREFWRIVKEAFK